MKNNIIEVQNVKVNVTNINWLACIYGVHHLNPYKMGVFKN